MSNFEHSDLICVNKETLAHFQFSENYRDTRNLSKIFRIMAIDGSRFGVIMTNNCETEIEFQSQVKRKIAKFRQFKII